MSSPLLGLLLLLLLLQMNSPIYKWQLWDPEVRYTRRCMARHNELIREKVERLRAAPPAAHTIAGTQKP
jgi:cell division inhibitor SulA